VPELNRTLVWSYGGGVQSVAIGVLVARGKLPRPDLVVMADTSREGTATWEYLHGTMQPYLDQVGLTVEIAPHSLACSDLYRGSAGKFLLLPAYWGASAKNDTRCSQEWKVEVIGRQLRMMGVSQCVEWLGFSYDELRRIKPDVRKWRRRAYPLIDLLFTRADCYNIIETEGLPTPPKSACWCCPHRNSREWRFLRDNYPQDWRAAIQLEREIRERDPLVWLHRDRVPLGQADIDSDTRLDVGQCGLGYCFL